MALKIKNLASPEPEPPASLSPESQAFWRTIGADHEIDANAATVLGCRLAAIDNLETQIASEGILLVDRFGQKKTSPLAKLVRDARRDLLDFAKLLPRRATFP